MKNINKEEWISIRRLCESHNKNPDGFVKKLKNDLRFNVKTFETEGKNNRLFMMSHIHKDQVNLFNKLFILKSDELENEQSYLKNWIPIRRVCESFDLSPNGWVRRLNKDPRFLVREHESKGKDGIVRKMSHIHRNQIDLFKETYVDNTKSGNRFDDVYSMNEEWVSITDICGEVKKMPGPLISRIKYDDRFTLKFLKGKSGYVSYHIPIDQEPTLRQIIGENNFKASPIYTYIIWDGKSDFVKIGRSDNPLYRLKKHQSTHKSLQIIYLIEGNKEKFFKDNYAKYRIDKSTEHYWLVPQMVEAWEQFEDVNERFM